MGFGLCDWQAGSEGMLHLSLLLANLYKYPLVGRMMNLQLVQRSFQAVKQDITSLKLVLHEWLCYLQYKDYAQEQRIARLEQRVAELEEMQGIIRTQQ